MDWAGGKRSGDLGSPRPIQYDVLHCHIRIQVYNNYTNRIQKIDCAVKCVSMSENREQEELTEHLSKDFILICYNQTLKDASALLKEKGGHPEWVLLVSMDNGSMWGAPFKSVSGWISGTGKFDYELEDLLDEPGSPLAKIETVDKFEDDLDSAQQIASQNMYGLCAISAFEDVLWVYRPVGSADTQQAAPKPPISSAPPSPGVREPKAGSPGAVQTIRDFYNRWRVGVIIGVIWFAATAIMTMVIPALKINPSDVLPSVFPPVMTGEWNLVVTGFTPAGEESVSSRDARHISEVFFNHFANEIDTLGTELGVYVEKIGPGGSPRINGKTPEEREAKAANLADRMKADMVIYGTIERSGDGYLLKPEFYVNVRNFYEASEMVGQHTLGSDIRLSGVGERLSAQINLNRELTKRSEVLALIAKGLGMFLTHQYEYALDLFTKANDDSFWEIDAGREVVYLFQGNAALRAQDLDAAESAYRRALRISSEYSRAYVGLGGYYYLLSFEVAKATGSPPDINWLNTALENYRLAQDAQYQPDSADIPAKTAYGGGLVYLAMWVYGSDTVGQAQEAFNSVIEQFGEGENVRLQEMASESHANLGLIARQTTQIDEAVYHYTAAVKWGTNPSRRGLYSKILAELFATKGDTDQSEAAYTNCITEYTAAIKLTSLPDRRATFWANISACHEGLENYQDAVFALGQSIDNLPLESPQRLEVEKRLEQLEAKLDA